MAGIRRSIVKVIVGQMAGKKESITALTMGFQSRHREQPARFSAVKKSSSRSQVGLTGAELTAARDRSTAI
jgi:hypothetical protein